MFAKAREMTDPIHPAIDAVVIGRNEGARLVACLKSLHGQVRRVVYVDSGSSDGSVGAARAYGAEVVALDIASPFTAARARNAGLARLATDPPEFVQMLDADCILQPDWIAAAVAGFGMHAKAVVVCGRRRELFPDRSVYNRMADMEWNTPVGRAAACGGDALVRYASAMAVGGYRSELIAGEEPEFCLRLQRGGGEIWRLAAEMTLHDAALLRFGQWWRRSVRSGYAFAEGAALHRGGPESYWLRETRRALFWGLGLPIAAVGTAFLHSYGWLLLLAFPAQLFRLSLRGGFTWAFFTVVGKFAEARGVASYWYNRRLGRRKGLIEYK